MENPFQPINNRLTNLEGLTLEVLQLLRRSPNTDQNTALEPISQEVLCKRLDISKPTAWAWEKKGLITGHHLGNRKYYIWQEVLGSLTKKGVQPA
jgi:hypothetical protein